jgi:hypothetical protein
VHVFGLGHHGCLDVEKQPLSASCNLFLHRLLLAY